MSKADDMEEERILRLLLLATKAYQDNFDKLRKELSEKNRDYLNLTTVQGSNTREEVKLLSQIDLYEIHNIQDLISKAEEIGWNE